MGNYMNPRALRRWGDPINNKEEDKSNVDSINCGGSVAYSDHN